MDDELEQFVPEEGEWYCTMTMGIDEVRALYHSIDGWLQYWPGAPARPYDEQEYLHTMKKRLFAMLCDYNFSKDD